MLKLKFTDHYDYPIDLVFSTYRDKQAEYGPLVPNLTKVVILKREERSEDEIFLSVEWHGFGQIPAAVRAILRPKMISWKDTQLWNSKELTNTWTIIPNYFKEFVKCEGQWKFFDEGEKTRVELDGIFSVNITRFPPFPRSLCRAAGPMIEKFIARYLKPNLIANSRALKKYFAKELGSKK